MRDLRVVISNDQKTVKIPKGIRMIVRRCCKAILSMEGFTDCAEIFINFTDDEGFIDLNSRYLNSPSDKGVLVLPTGENNNFPENQSTGAKMLGNVIISIEKAMFRSESLGRTLEREVGYLTVHGVLGLFGYKSSKGIEKAMLNEKEEYIMEQIGLPLAMSYVSAE